MQKIWQKTNRLIATAKNLNTAFHTCLAVEDYGKEDFKPDLLRIYTVEQMVAEAKEQLIKAVINDTLKKHEVRNLKIPQEVWTKFYKKAGFSAKQIEAYIMKNFVAKADEVAMQQLLEEAKRLVPWIWEHGERKPPKADALVKGFKLTLDAYWSYGGVGYQELDHIRALEKIMNVVICGVPASKAETRNIADLISVARQAGQARTYSLTMDKLIDKFRVFKNGKFEITFKKAQNAKRIANVLTAK